MSWLTDEEMGFLEMQQDIAISHCWKKALFCQTPSKAFLLGPLCPFTSAHLSAAFTAPFAPITPDPLLCFPFVRSAL